MDIKIKTERYINADEPILTDKMLDWLFLSLWQSFINYYDSKSLKKLEKIDIKANQAYNGSSRIHFYITINDEFHIHKVFQNGLKLSMQTPSVGFGDEPTPERWEWLYYFIQYGDVDCGKEGIECMKRIKKRNDKWEKVQAIKRETMEKEARYKLYLKLKKEFEEE